MKKLTTIGISSGLGTDTPGASLGPETLANSSQFKQLLRREGLSLQWQLLTPKSDSNRINRLTTLFHEVRSTIGKTVAEGRPFAVIGGDHSIAMGVWPGVMAALYPKKLGLIWIDAHLDLHTMETSPSLNLHGMPAAALLGEQDKTLKRIYQSDWLIAPENLVFMGEHAHEPEELKLVQRLGLTSFSWRASQRHSHQAGSLSSLFKVALQKVTTHTDFFGISIDLDAIDPSEAPGVNTPESGGFTFKELHGALQAIATDERLIAIEIAEFNPTTDRHHQTEQLIAELIGLFYGEQLSYGKQLGYGERNSEKRSLGSANAGSKSTSRPTLSSPLPSSAKR